jgi:enamine deaminase RidA (YjgF/YER057c/UK114 family)
MARRTVLEVEGVHHRAPIPMGVEIGGLVFSSGISGQDPSTGEFPPDPARQAELMFQHVRTLLAEAGAGPETLAKMTVFVTDNAYREHVNHEWLKLFPDESDRPARHTFRWDLPDGMLVQCEIVAVLDSR